MLASPVKVPVSGTWLRHIPAGGDPLHRPSTPADGRWQRGAAIEGIYLAADVNTVWAEWYRWLAEHRSSRCVDSRASCGATT